MNYGTYSGAPYAFNPWVQFIHGDAILPDQLGMPGVYAYSVDDAVGNLNVEAQGYIIDIGSTKHQENQRRAAPPVNISLGFSPDAPVRFLTYGVCGNDPSQQKPVNPANPQFIISPADPENCPVYLTDNKSPAQTYTFTVTAPPPFTLIPTADVRKNLASWSSGNGRPTKYNTTAVIDCRGNTGMAPSQSSKAWCCTLLPDNGQGVFAYSTPEVPPTAHQTLIQAWYDSSDAVQHQQRHDLQHGEIANFMTDVGDNGGANAPDLVDRDTPGHTIGFSWAETGGLVQGDMSDLLLIDTNASRFTTGTLAVIDSQTSDLTGYEPSPVPEAATWAMMLIGFAGLGVAGYRGSGKSAAFAS